MHFVLSVLFLQVLWFSRQVNKGSGSSRIVTLFPRFLNCLMLISKMERLQYFCVNHNLVNLMTCRVTITQNVTLLYFIQGYHTATTICHVNEICCTRRVQAFSLLHRLWSAHTSTCSRKSFYVNVPITAAARSRA